MNQGLVEGQGKSRTRSNSDPHALRYAWASVEDPARLARHLLRRRCCCRAACSSGRVTDSVKHASNVIFFNYTMSIRNFIVVQDRWRDIKRKILDEVQRRGQPGSDTAVNLSTSSTGMYSTRNFEVNLHIRAFVLPVYSYNKAQLNLPLGMLCAV